jgi:hypothetical protein
MTALTLAALAALLPGAPGDAPLAGRWVHKTEFLTVTSTLLPDGRYFSETRVGDVVVPERGKYAVKDGVVTLAPIGGEAAALPFALDGDTLVVTGPGGLKMAYKRVATAAEVAAEAKKADAAKDKEDAAWRERFPVAAMKAQPKHVAVGAVPDDKNVKQVFETPDVFASPQLYFREGNQEFVFERGAPPGRFKTYFNWHFLPTGRVYVDATSYTGGVEVPRALRGPLPTYYATGKTESKKFGKYKIDHDEVAIEMDDGEKVRVSLIDGRRNLLWGDTVYGNVVWEREALKGK